ncbi:MAG: hypothetical protein GX896_00935 [Clostridiales bacterium]|nr:hypothetical protein [Clostridiales bacterium]
MNVNINGAIIAKNIYVQCGNFTVNRNESVAVSVDNIEYTRTNQLMRLYAYYDEGKKEIIREKYENGVSWTDSKGDLIERFAINNGELYGFGRQNVAGKYKFFSHHYSKDGDVLGTETIPGFENIIGTEQAVEFFLVDEYIIFRTYETLTGYICKRGEKGTELIMKGENGSVYYAVSEKENPYIFFIEGNVSGDGTIKEKDCPLYAIDVESGVVKAAKFTVPIENPYFIEFQMLSNY